MNALGALFLGAIGLLAACSPSPCASCLQVAGSYQETVIAANVGCGGSQYLSFSGDSAEIDLSQTGSALSFLSDSGASMSGALNSDGSAAFGPEPATAEPVDADGNADPGGMPIPGQLYLNGFFTSSDGSTSFEGTYYFVATNDGCEVDARAQWTQ